MSHRTNLLLARGPSTLAFLVALLFPLSAIAIDADGTWRARGIGSKNGTCGDYVRTETEIRHWYEHWLMGYVSGVNRAKPGKADYSNDVAAQGLLQWIENYCQQNPLSSFSGAVDAILEELAKKP